MDLVKFSETNLKRCMSVTAFNHNLETWSPAEWTNAIAGEVGEACNLAKKLIRHRDGIPGNIKKNDLSRDDLKERIAHELADVIVYADLAIQSLGYDTTMVLRYVFNRKSKQIESDILV